MNKEFQPRNIDRPIAVLSVDSNEITGSYALMAYALIYLSKKTEPDLSYDGNGYSTIRDLAEYQRDRMELKHRSFFRAEQQISRVKDFFDRVGNPVEVDVLPGTGEPLQYRLSKNDPEAYKRLINSYRFTIESSKGFRDSRGFKPRNSLSQIAIRDQEKVERLKIKVPSDLYDQVQDEPSYDNSKKLYDAIVATNNRKLLLSILSKGVDPRFAEGNLEILDDVFNTELTFTEIGEKHHKNNRQSTSQIVRSSFNRIYNALPEDFKERHPIQTFAFPRRYNPYK